MSYYFTNDETLKSEVKTINVIINNLPFSFYTDNGVFSKKGLDFGTRTLLENLPDLKGNVLDIGCGYGPIGIYISKKYDLLVTLKDMVEENVGDPTPSAVSDLTVSFSIVGENPKTEIKTEPMKDVTHIEKIVRTDYTSIINSGVDDVIGIFT